MQTVVVLKYQQINQEQYPQGVRHNDLFFLIDDFNLIDEISYYLKSLILYV